jgi:hypothetical protein
MGKQRTFSLGRIILTDHCTCFAISAIIIFWIIYIATIQFGYFPDIRYAREPLTETAAPFFYNMGVVATLTGIPMIGWRIRFFQTLYRRGVEVNGHIYLEYVLSTKRVEYKYTYQGIDYWRGNALADSKYQNYYNDGDEVILLIDPQNPKRAIIKDLYF